MGTAHPIVLSLQVCDAVHVDPISGKTYMLGCLAGLGAGPLPRAYPQIHVAVELTNGHGEIVLGVRILRSLPEALEGEEVAAVELGVAFRTPRDEIAVGVDFAEVEFPAPGSYRVVVESEGHALLERKLVVG